MSHNSPRSRRIKQEARTRPDATHKDQAVPVALSKPKSILTGGSELSQRIKKSDDHLVAMRKIVQ